MKNLLIIILFITTCQTSAIARPDMIVEHYTKEDGLPSNTVYSALKDKDGFIWFGTWHGLCSFDGAQFTPYTTRPSHLYDVPPQKVRNIVEDKDGYLWIRNTDNHLYMFDKVTEAYDDTYNKLKRLSHNVQVIKIQRMDNGHVLVLTRNKDLFEVWVENGKVSAAKIYDSRHDIDGNTMRLKHNVIGENSKYVFWLSTNLNIDIITKKNGKPLLPKITGGDHVTCFKHTGQYLCYGTRKGTIYVTNINSSHTRRYSVQTSGGSVSSVDIINGKLYFTTAKGLYSLSDKSSPIFVTDKAAKVYKSFVDKYNKLWLCSSNGQMTCHDPATSSQLSFSLPTDSLFAEMKFIDAGTNGLFILQRNGDVWHFDHVTKLMQNINILKEFNDDVSDTHFFDIDIDSNGIMWLSSTTSGVFKVCFPKYSFKFLFADMFKQNGTGSETKGIRAIYQTRAGDLWLGTRNGELYCVDAKSGKIKHKFDADDVGVVYNIMEDKEGNLWFSTKGSGLVKATHDAMAADGFRFTRYVNRHGDINSISSNRVYYTYQDSRGRIWVCTFYGGLNLMEERGGKVVFRHKRNGMKSYPGYELYTDVRIITEGRDGRMWVGTTDGLMSFDGKFNKASDIKFETYRDRNSSGETSNDISTMYKDKAGNIWLGIFGNGLKRIKYYDKKKCRPVLESFTVNDKGGNVITSIVEDKNNCLWIGTENGIASLKQGSSFMKSYDRFTGFPNVTVEDNTSVCLNDGRILVGCHQGLLAFDPAVVMNENDIRYKTFIIDFKVANRDLEDFDPPIYQGSVKFAKRITLKHNQSTFTIEFSSPYYADNGLVPYAYILDGYESQWHNNGNNRIALYANVPPGHYKFRVKVNDGNSPECVLEVVVLPPWWATWWAYVIYTVLITLALYAVLRTITYVIRMRNEVYINDRLAELKIRFFTNISHELRTPLSLIKGPVEELKTTEKLSNAGKEYLDLIERNSTKMLRLVNQILDFRKIQNGKMKLHVSFVDITGIVEILMNEFKVMAKERDIAFEADKPDERIMAWCDAEKIGVVLNNLISNAFKYTDDGGKICIALNYDHDRQTCTIKVEDDGVGIPQSQLELIFERFSQADNKTSGDNAYAGTGIGLSLSKEYVNMHHGRIWAENISGGKGVVFSVEIPTDKDHFNDKEIEVYFDDSTAGSNILAEDKADAAEDRQANTNNEDSNVPTIMLIEDNVDMCRMLQLQLGTYYNVISSHDGNDGLKKIYQYHPDVIITDLMMPGISGLDLLRSVRQDFNISHIPVIILTAKNTEEDKMMSVKAGANAFITKPFSSSYLIARVDQLLEEQRIFQRKMVVQTAVDTSGESTVDEYEQHLVKKDIEFMHKIHEIIENNLNSNDFNIDTIAETIGLSRSAFFKKLKSLTGFAPVDLVREIRLTKAARLIETTDNSITEIAYSVGFRDVGYFGKCFRKKYDKTPKEYRNDIRGKS